MAGAIVLILCILLLHAVAANPNLEWRVVWHYLFASAILHGLQVTVELTVICQSIGIILGVILATMRLLPNKALSIPAWIYVWFFRGVPLLIQLIFWYNLGFLFPRMGVPFLGISVKTNSVINGFVAAILGLGLNEGAYMAEIVRGGTLAVDAGQFEAAQALGMTKLLTLRRIILPQAMRVIIPPTGNRVISLLKDTSLVAFIAGGDLLTTVQNVYTSNFEVIPLLVVAAAWYLFVVSIATVLQHYLENHFKRDAQHRQAAPLANDVTQEKARAI